VPSHPGDRGNLGPLTVGPAFQTPQEGVIVTFWSIGTLVEHGPGLGRPLADKIPHAKHHGMKELRPPSWEQTKDKAAALGLGDPERTERVQRLMVEYLHSARLAEIRKRRGRSQTELAQAMGVGQGRVSQIENTDLSRASLATLESYVEALGGHVRVVADFGDDQVQIA